VSETIGKCYSFLFRSTSATEKLWVSRKILLFLLLMKQRCLFEGSSSCICERESSRRLLSLRDKTVGARIQCGRLDPKSF